MAAKKRRKRQRGPRGEGYVTWDESRQRWRAVVGPKSKYFRTESEAALQRQAWVEEARRPVAAPTAPDRQVVTEALLEMLDSQDWIAPDTRRNRMVFIDHITAHIGLTAVGDVTPTDIGAMDRVLRGRMSGERASQILGYLSTLYKRLIALRVLTYNPVTAYQTITPARAREGRPLNPPRTLDAGMCRLALRELADDPYGPIITWMLVLGLRAGEARGIRWANVGRDTVAIIEQRRERDRHTPAPLKTEREVGHGRVLPLPAVLLALTPRDGDDLVFPAPFDSGAIRSATLRTHWHKACVRARVPAVRPHDLRHSCATGLALLGCPEHLISAQLGHAKRTQTQEYIARVPELLRPWVEEWAGLVLGEGAQKLSSNVL